MLSTFVFPQQLGYRQPAVISQQDGEPPHLGMDALDRQFPNRWIGCDGPTELHGQYDHLTLHIRRLLLGFVKDYVMLDQLETLCSSEKITNADGNVPQMPNNADKQWPQF